MSLRIIQWGAGNVGYHSLLHLIEHPDHELAGVHSRSLQKVGKVAAHDPAVCQHQAGMLST